MEHASRRPDQLGHETELIGRPHQGLLAEHVHAALERGPDESRVARRRRADVDEVEPRVGEEGFGGVVPARPGQALGADRALGGAHVADGDDLDVRPLEPAGQVAVDRHVAETDDGCRGAS